MAAVKGSKYCSFHNPETRRDIKPKVQFRLPSALRDKLVRTAAKRGKTQTALIEDLIESL